LHNKVVKPALALLNNLEYKTAEEKFYHAYDLYNHGNYSDAIGNCRLALESTLKIICQKYKWEYKKGECKELIEICMSNELIDKFWQSKFEHLKGLLKNSVPVGGNKRGMHIEPNEDKAPSYLVSYILHMTAASILFLIQAEKNLTKKS
jgi:hypothetical protein